MTRWIVDGMNVIGSRPTGWWRDRPRAIRELVDELAAFAAEIDEPVTVVFDGRRLELEGAGPGEARDEEPVGRVEVRFASRRGRNAADDDIAALVSDSPEPTLLRVVTSDRDLERRVRESGADVMGAGAFRARLDELSGP